MDRHEPTVSVIVRAYNEGQHIGRLLEGLAAQTHIPMEVILVDSGSTDDTVTIAAAAGCKIVRIEKHEFSFGRALNRGCAAAAGDVLLILSAHVYPIFDSFVEEMVAAFSRPGVQLAYGRQVGDHRTKFSESRVMSKWFPPESIWDQGHPFSNNANAAVLRAAWAESPYDEALTGLEDLAFAQKLIQRGGKVAYVADAPVVHVHEETWAVVQNRYRREAIAYAKIFPNSKLSLAKAAILAVTNTASDFAFAVRTRQLRGNIAGIPRFRFAQFVGAWQGFREREALSGALLERFYYPPAARGQEAQAVKGNPIRYSETFERFEI